jgi:hypothetical protein
MPSSINNLRARWSPESISIHFGMRTAYTEGSYRKKPER